MRNWPQANKIYSRQSRPFYKGIGPRGPMLQFIVSALRPYQDVARNPNQNCCRMGQSSKLKSPHMLKHRKGFARNGKRHG